MLSYGDIDRVEMGPTAKIDDKEYQFATVHYKTKRFLGFKFTPAPREIHRTVYRFQNLSPSYGSWWAVDRSWLPNDVVIDTLRAKQEAKK